ncbi:hypothetical protein V5T82_10890 [Magnetovibrio sp. PR-2]|uniref:hypothetical protein n=1 Tax=Magnetovibrio sp. PR-2 TaxID=3120356 RepID=UPI002FCE5628
MSKLSKFQFFLFAVTVGFGGLFIASAIIERTIMSGMQSNIWLIEFLLMISLPPVALLTFGNLLVQLVYRHWVLSLYSAGIFVLAVMMFVTGLIIDPTIPFAT